MRTARALLLVGVLTSACTPSDDALVVFAASSLADVVEAAADLQPDTLTRISVGPTSMLSQQIQQGAPADIFLAAHPRWVELLVEAGRTHSEPVDLASGSLVIVARSESSPARSAAAALANADRIALADPSHVPAGQYAEGALRALGVWDAVIDKIHPVADVRAALVAVQRGAADVAIVYASDALATEELAVVYRFEASMTPDIRYVGVAVSDDPEALAWIRTLESSEMQTVWREHGFGPPQP